MRERLTAFAHAVTFATATTAFLFLSAVSAASQPGAGITDNLAAMPAGAVWMRDDQGRVTIRATRVAEPIKVDGRLDDAAYDRVPPITAFVQMEPREGDAISEQTEFWVLFDDENIYVACRCWEAHPEKVVANEMRRDNVSLRLNDNVGLSFDTFHDRRTASVFSITPLGAVLESAISESSSPSIDWNTLWNRETGRFEAGWVFEVAIPFRSLRYPAGRDQVWGMQVRRSLHGASELAFLSPVARSWGLNGMNSISSYATLVGLEVPPAGWNLEVKPYAISHVATDLLARPAIRNHHDPDAGVDIKYGITKSLTLDLTYNTDFAQVEADEAQVNLTRFSLSFPEKRDFFLEGQTIFNFAGAGPGAMINASEAPTIFYSRRIGLSGTTAIPLVAGARITGKAGPWTIGALNIETDDEASVGAAQTNFTVARMQRDVLQRSVIGGIFTHRSVSTKAPGGNAVWGLDTALNFGRDLYINGYLAQSRTQGLNGNDLSYRALFSYNADRYGLAVDRMVVQPNFNPEAGLLRRENLQRSFASARFSPRPNRSRLVRKFTYESSLEYITDNDGRLESRELRGRFVTDLQNTDALSFQYLRTYEFLPVPFQIEDAIKIPVGRYLFDTVTAAWSTGQQHRVAGTASVDLGTFYDGRKQTVTFKGRVELTPRLGVEPNLSLNWIALPQRYFTSTVVGSRTTFTMTPRMFVAALVQYASSNTSLSTNLRFRWEYQPGSELFVVYTEGRDTLPPRRTALENRGFVVKINKLFRF